MIIFGPLYMELCWNLVCIYRKTMQ